MRARALLAFSLLFLVGCADTLVFETNVRTETVITSSPPRPQSHRSIRLLGCPTVWMLEASILSGEINRWCKFTNVPRNRLTYRGPRGQYTHDGWHYSYVRYRDEQGRIQYGAIREWPVRSRSNYW